MTKPLDVAFEKYRQKKYGAHPYPIDDYTMFGVGWKAAVEASAVIALSIDSKRGNEKHIADPIRRLSEE